MTRSDGTSQGIFRGVRRVYLHASKRRRMQFWVVVSLMLVGALVEIVSLGAVMPFLALIANPGDVAGAGPIRTVATALGWTEAGDLLVPATVAFIAAAIISGGLRLLLSWAGSKFIMRLGHELTVDVYDKTLHQPYSYHVQQNTSELIASVAKVQRMTAGVLLALLEALVSAVLAFFILVALFVIDPVIAVASAFGFGSMYLAVSGATRRRLLTNSKIISIAETERVKAIQEGLGGIRDVLIGNAQHVYLAKFRDASLALNDSHTANMVIAASPRFVLETFGIVMISGLAMVLLRAGGKLSDFLPVLGALALGAQKLLPLLQRVYSGWTQALGNAQLMSDVLVQLDLDVDDAASRHARPLKAFRDSLVLRGVVFRYGQGPVTLKDVNLTIRKGSHVGVVGPTGSGKSTLIDILLGLLEPSEGAIEVDGEVLRGSALIAWQRNVAHVPQSIYLSDATIAENVAFGESLDELDMDMVREMARRVHLADFIESLPDGYNTEVGERGVRLSGGQRQRVGIARALYKKADVLVLDEATSALDGQTEASVMSAIEEIRKDLTIVTIAHRETTLRHCDKVVRIDAGSLVDEGTFEQVVVARRKAALPSESATTERP